MIRVEFFCTRCNQSAVRRDPGDEVNTGYVAQIFGGPTNAERDIWLPPPGWGIVHGVLVCNACLESPEPRQVPPRREDIPDAAEVEREVAALSPGYAAPPSGWPSRRSPFEHN